MKIQWEPRDIWIGLHWNHELTTTYYPPGAGSGGQYAEYKTYKFYLCIIPCFPISWECERK